MYNHRIKQKMAEEREKQKHMEEYMRDSMRKLALWYTRTFKPIMTHDELDPIMATLGFVSSFPSTANGNGDGAWREYVYSAVVYRSQSLSAAAAEPLPRPRLPYPRIDGLHIYTYRAFIDAVNFYLEMSDISDLFHIRGMPLHRIHDRSKKKWWRMEEDDSGVIVYREGTLEKATYNFYHLDEKNSVIGESPHNNSINIIRKHSNPITHTCCLVPLKDIIV